MAKVRKRAIAKALGLKYGRGWTWRNKKGYSIVNSMSNHSINKTNRFDDKLFFESIKSLTTSQKR